LSLDDDKDPSCLHFSIILNAKQFLNDLYFNYALSLSLAVKNAIRIFCCLVKDFGFPSAAGHVGFKVVLIHGDKVIIKQRF
jgi:hypothetical protein